MNPMHRINGSHFVIESLDDGSVIVWDMKLERALDEWIDQGMPMETRPPFPIVASGLSEEEAFDWLMEKLGLEVEYIPLTRIQ